ncbi:MAG: M48 family metalloprotease [Candidatus Woesearchaeota archaeon]
MSERLNFHEEVRKNKFMSIVLMVLFFFILIGLGWIIGFIYSDMIVIPSIFGILALIYSLIMYKAGTSVVIKLSGARPVTKQEYPHYFHTIEGLALAAGIPQPKAYVIDDPSLNAFAAGTDPKKAIVAVTTGLLKKANREQLEGVLAHEVAHIRNYDVRLMLVATIFVGIITLISEVAIRMLIFGGGRNRGGGKGGHPIMIIIGVIFIILAPIFAYLVKLAVSRKREFVADADGARLTRYPEGLASALELIKQDAEKPTKFNKGMEHMYFSNPVKKGFWKNLFSTHPDTDERIKRLRSM